LWNNYIVEKLSHALLMDCAFVFTAVISIKYCCAELSTSVASHSGFKVGIFSGLISVGTTAKFSTKEHHLPRLLEISI